MRLTKTHREAFVRAAMNDVPSIDYRQSICELIQKHLESIAPASVLKLYKDPKTKGYIAKDTLPTLKWAYDYFYLIPDGYSHPPEIIEKTNDLRALSARQEDSHKELRIKLEATIAAFTTREAALKSLPEFEKYLPEDKAPETKNVPMVANLVAELVAAGWPKQKAEAEAKKRVKK